MTNTIPFLKRKFENDTDIGLWVLEQMPVRHGAEARGKYAGLTADEKKNPHAVAGMCVDIIASARPTSILMKEGPLAEFVGIMGEGRRPSGMQRQQNQRQSQGQRQTSSTSGAGQSESTKQGGGDRPTVCSVVAPRGPMCKHGHKHPCWRDNQWAGPLPRYVLRNSAAVKAIERDRAANAHQHPKRVSHSAFGAEWRW